MWNGALIVLHLGGSDMPVNGLRHPGGNILKLQHHRGGGRGRRGRRHRQPDNQRKDDDGSPAQPLGA